MSSLKSASADEIGRQPVKIEIADYRLNAHTSSWTAACDGSTYYCSGWTRSKNASLAIGPAQRE